MLPKISIVMPSYNQGQYIEDAIESVFNQEYPNVELIIIDAISTDETLDKIRTSQYIDNIILISEKDEGQTDAINKGFAIATGDIVAWLNCDDYYIKGTFKIISQAFISNPDVDIFYGNVHFVSKDRTILRTKREHRFDRNILLYFITYISSTSTFFRRRILDDGVFLDKTFKVTMDFEYFMRLDKLKYKFKFINRTLASFRWHGDNISLLYNERRLKERNIVISRFTRFNNPDLYYIKLTIKFLRIIFRIKRQVLIILDNK